MENTAIIILSIPGDLSFIEQLDGVEKGATFNSILATGDINLFMDCAIYGIWQTAISAINIPYMCVHMYVYGICWHVWHLVCNVWHLYITGTAIYLAQTAKITFPISFVVNAYI